MGHEDLVQRLLFYDPASTLRQLQLPTLALFGELDNNIMAEKNRAAWEAALKAGGHRDYTLRVLPKANHYQLEAKVGSNAEMPTLQRFVPAYMTTLTDWLSKRIRGFSADALRPALNLAQAVSLERQLSRETSPPVVPRDRIDRDS